MTIDKAIDLLRKEHARAESLPYVHKPVAWALYQVWKKADQEKERPSAADPCNKEDGLLQLRRVAEGGAVNG